MKKNRRKKNKDRQLTSQADDGPMVINFREQLKAQDPEVRDAALQLLRQAGVISVRDSVTLRAMLVDADKVADLGGGKFRATAAMRHVVVQVDDEQSDEQADESDQQIEELRTLVEETSGPWKYSGNLQDADKKPRFMFVCDGGIRIYRRDDLHGPILARTRKVAKQYVAWAKEHEGIKLVIADMPAVAHQSEEALSDNGLLAFFDNGTNCCFVIRMVDRENIVLDDVRPEDIIHTVDGWVVPSADPHLPKYMVTHKGQPLFYDDGEKHGPFLVHSRQVAERFVAEIEKKRGLKLSVADIQGVVGQTINEVLDLLVEDGANCACVIRSVADDGEAKSDFIYPVKPPAE